MNGAHAHVEKPEHIAATDPSGLDARNRVGGNFGGTAAFSSRREPGARPSGGAMPTVGRMHPGVFFRSEAVITDGPLRGFSIFDDLSRPSRIALPEQWTRQA